MISLMTLAALTCCDPPLFDKPGHENREDDRIRPAAPDSTRGKPVIYATALVFPETVNWRKGDTRGCQLVLFKDGVPIDTLSRYVSPSAESIHFQDGHLWTDVTDGSQTTITCDGRVLFSYPGEEKLRGFLVADGSVYTLGQHPGGGFSFRVNGEERYSSANGMILGGEPNPEREGGALCRDSSGVYYSFGLPVSTENAEMWEYRVMKEGEIRKMIPAQSGSRLFDIRVHKGVVFRLEHRYGRTCLVEEDDLTPLDLPETAHEMTLVPLGRRMGIKGFHEEGKATFIWIRNSEELLSQYTNPHGQPIANLFSQDGETAHVSLDYEGCVRVVRRDTMLVSLPLETYRLQTPTSLCYRKGLIALALTADDEDGDNLILINNRQIHLSFNGYFTGIYMQ